MSYSYRLGKDEVHFITEEDLDAYTKAVKEEEASAQQSADSARADSARAENAVVSDEVQEQYPGAVSPSGEINWDCPCLGGLGTEGPCVEEFRSAFSCWMFSTADQEGGEKGDDCVDSFFTMSSCMQQNEEFYDELNARNKATAEEARAKYEEEEREKIAAAEAEQKALESSESESETTAVDLPAVTETETKTESETKVSAVYIPEPDFPKADFSSNNSVIVAATLEEQETEEQEVVEKESDDRSSEEKS